MRALGIDCGKTGAVALIADTVSVEDVQTTPDGGLDCDWFFGLLERWSPDCAVIEAVYRPNCLVEMKGEYVACCKLYGIPLTSVPVVTWKKRLLGSNTSDKKVSLSKCSTLYPQANILRPSPKGRTLTQSPDRAEAVLLADWLRQINSPPISGR